MLGVAHESCRINIRHNGTPFQELARLPGNLVIFQEDVLWRRPVGLAPPAPNQHPQLVVPEQAERICVSAQRAFTWTTHRQHCSTPVTSGMIVVPLSSLGSKFYLPSLCQSSCFISTCSVTSGYHAARQRIVRLTCSGREQ